MNQLLGVFVDKSQLAILISILSVATATFSLGWNVYRDVLLKAKVKVSFGVKNVVLANAPPSPDYVGITATNHGSGPVTLSTIALKETSFLKKILRKKKFGFVTFGYDNPYSDKLPIKLEVGEGVDLFVDYNKDCFLSKSFTHLGINDTFWRTHWAPKNTMKKLRKEWSLSFGANA